MEVFVCAGDVSSETHAAAAIAEMKKIEPGLQTFGLGGDHLVAEGCELLMHCREFMVGGGPLEILSRLPKRSRLERALENRLYKRRPQGAILVDNGEINLRLAALLKFFKVPVVYYIPPKVWVWRSSRIETIAQHVDLVLSILPFEKEIYESWEIPWRFVGNPLLDEVPLALTALEARERLKLSDRPAVTLLPGSRHSEISHHTDLFAQTVMRFRERLRTEVPEELRHPDFLMPIASSLDFEKVSNGFAQRIPDLKLFKGYSHECMKVARAALIKSGTSTLEAGILGTPMVITYQSGKLATWMFKYILKYTNHVGLVNLILADEKPAVAPELILKKAVPEDLAEALLTVYKDGPQRQCQIDSLKLAPALLRPPSELGTSPSQAVAKLSIDLFRQG